MSEITHDDCDFSVHVRIVAFDGTTVRVDLNDHAAGYVVGRPLILPMEQMREQRVTATRVAGSYRVSSVEDDAAFPITVRVHGATWAQVETRWNTIRQALTAEDQFYLEVEVEGVKRRWLTERPNTEPGQLDLRNKRMPFVLTFRVQPNPSVTIA